MIHKSAQIDPKAKIGNNVTIGPWTLVGPDVEIGDDTIIESHVVVKGPTKIGSKNHIFQFCSVGEQCQDKKYAGEPTKLIIGDNNIIREGCSIHRGTVQGGGKTAIGNNNLLMNNVHVAHDCIIGNNIIIAGFSGLAGHVEVDDWVILGGYSAVHQFCKLGQHSFSAHNTVLNKDVLPYVLIGGHPAKSFGLNVEGLKRRGFKEEQIQKIQSAYKTMFRQGLTLEQAQKSLKPLAEESKEVAAMINFLPRASRGLVR